MCEHVYEEFYEIFRNTDKTGFSFENLRGKIEKFSEFSCKNLQKNETIFFLLVNTRKLLNLLATITVHVRVMECNT